MPFEINHPLAGSLKGGVTAYITEVDGVDPTVIIEADKAFKVHLNWWLDGALTPYVCGKWCIHLFLESIGPGPELKLPEHAIEIPLDPCPGRNDYAAWIVVPANTIKPEHCAVPYKMVATVTYRTPKDKPGPMAGFVDGPVLQFYVTD
jgi:hypothetical protein